jgi:hypothetical protein
LFLVARKATQSQQDQTWDDVKAIVQGCFREHNLNLSEVTMSFCSSIPSRPRYLKNFPDQWDSSMKSTYLMEKCAYRLLSPRINKSNLKWPTKDGQYEPLVIKLIELGKEYAKYDFNFPNDYVSLCRNTYKHFNSLPLDMKVCGLNLRPGS